MPPKAKITREDILAAALALVREEGEAALNARALAARLGCSTQPIFCHYASMEALREAALRQGYLFYYQQLESEMARGKYPAYKASGMLYISFAVREPRLFQWLFMRSRTTPERQSGFFTGDEGVLAALMEATGLTREEAERFHFAMWMWVHGVAASVVSGFLDFDEEAVSAHLSDIYFGLRARYLEKGASNEKQH